MNHNDEARDCGTGSKREESLGCEALGRGQDWFLHSSRHARTSDREEEMDGKQ